MVTSVLIIHQRGKPADALATVQNRLRKAKILNDELADYFKERAVAEEAYSRALQKATKRPLFTGRSSLGPLGPVVDSLVGEISRLSDSHLKFAKRLTDEIEVPLRQQATIGEWSKLKQYDTNLSATIKEYDEKISKIDKYRKRMDTGKKAEQTRNKMADASRALDESRMEWETEAPIVFDKYQSVDQHRLDMLKEAVARFETMQSDQAQQTMQLSERTMQLVLNFDTMKDIEDFCSTHAAQMIASNDTHNYTRQSAAAGQPAIRERASEDSSLQTGTFSAGGGLRSALGGVFRSRTRTSDRGTVRGDSFSQSRTSVATEQIPDVAPTIPPLPTQQQLQAPSESLMPTGTTQQQPMIRVDDEGFSIPPPDRKPWEMTGGELSPGGLQEETDNTGRPLKLEIMNNAITEPNSDAASALNRVQSTLQSKSTISRRPGARGRRDVRMTMYNSLPEGNQGAFAAGSSAAAGEAAEVSTIASSNAESFGSAPGSPVGSVSRMPAFSGDATSTSGTGLQASISETVNVLSKLGDIVKVFVTGEISLVAGSGLEANSSANGDSKVHLRIGRFEALEKAAPNTNYLTAIPELPGEYKVDIGLLSLSGGKPVVVLKYQVHTEADKLKEYVPIIVSPAWRCEPTQTSLMVNLGTNAECRLLRGNADAKLSEVSIVVGVDGGVQGVQSKPEASWNKETGRLTWRIEEIGESHKLLARLKVANASRPQPASMRWRASGGLMSGLSLEVVDGPELETVHLQAVSGKYVAQP